MIIRSVRLKNIKSYGAGATGEGVTVRFEPGVNRIAGRNGHGKSTLIEAIGYALFLATPDFAENFGVDTYLLRNGTKEAEIDVTFEHLGDAYRVERGLGKSSHRRTKVIDLKDESICAEGDKEVTLFLCDRLGVPSGKHLMEVFTKLIGVKQGRLTRPFDSRGAEARRFFEPLFDVAIFKECHDKLKPARDQFEARLGDTREQKAGVDQKIADRADSGEKLARARESIKRQQAETETAIQARNKAKAERDQHAQFKEALGSAEKRRDQAHAELKRVREHVMTVKERLADAEKARATARETLPAHEHYLAADKRLKALERQRMERDRLKEQRNLAEKQRHEHQSAADSARQQAETFSSQQVQKTEELEKKNRDREALDRKLSDSLPAFEKVEKTFAMLEASSPELQGWHAGLPATSKRITEGAVELHRWHREVSSWKPEPLGEAEASHRKTNAALEAAQARWTELRERQATLKSQSEQISGGVCPFLKETCQQFDPGKVEADLSAMTQEIEQGKQLSEARKKDHQVAGEVLDKLKRQEAQLRPRQESLESGGRDIMRELDTLLPKRVRDGAANLRAWDERIHELPVPPPVPEVFKPEDVDDIAAAVNAFVNKAQAWWHALEQVMKERNAHQVKARTERAREEQSLVQLKQRNEELATETRRLSEEAQAKRSEAGKRTGEAAASQKKVTEYDHQLKPHASLEDSLKAQREGLETHREAHEKHLQSRECAASLEERKQALASAASKLEEADLRLKDETRQWTEADKAFDQEALDKAIAHYESRRDAVATMDNNLVHARKAKDEEEQRFKAWEQACRELDGIKAQMDRLETSIEITDLARKVLKDAAPAVAQHLCNRIAGRAKTVFNQINPDPIDLQWEAKQYSVRIVPDDRRFAMLSGGEQTKLALALTLAMIEEFGGLRFCIFDEPTYGVDADSRQKLADAIIAMQSAAHLEQLLLVSHDDAFDGKIEHAILLKKSAGSGSAVNLGA